MVARSHVKSSEVMRTDVETLSPDDTIARALLLFEDQRISGAPVVDEQGRLVGVLTLSDVLRAESVMRQRIAIEPGTFEMSEPVGEEQVDELDPDEVFFVKEDYSGEARGAERVADWMTREVITVSPDATLEEACAVMVNQHIHRVFVTDGDKLSGIISSFDVVREVARANGGDESRQG